MEQLSFGKIFWEAIGELTLMIVALAIVINYDRNTLFNLFTLLILLVMIMVALLLKIIAKSMIK